MPRHCSADNVNELPIEILISILSILEPRDIFNTMRVCRFWNSLSNDRWLWKALFTKQWGKTSEVLVRDPNICWKTMYHSQAMLFIASPSKSPVSCAARETGRYGRKRRRDSLLLQDEIDLEEEEEDVLHVFIAVTPPRSRRRTEEDMTPREKQHYLHDLRMREHFAALDEEPLLVEAAAF